MMAAGITSKLGNVVKSAKSDYGKDKTTDKKDSKDSTGKFGSALFNAGKKALAKTSSKQG